MAARKKIRHDESTRAKIQSSQLVNFLQSHVLRGRKAEKSQITAAIALLKKTLPDLHATELSGSLAVSHEEAIDELERAEQASAALNERAQ